MTTITLDVLECRSDADVFAAIEAAADEAIRGYVHLTKREMREMQFQEEV